MKAVATYVIAGVLALAAALATVHGEAGKAELHVADAARGDAIQSVEWLWPSGR
jgi:hypothetical protein